MIRFDLKKTIEAAAYLIKKQPGKIENYMRLLKLLYIADRKSLERRNAPISGDTPYALKRGPVPSTTLDLIKGSDPRSRDWDPFIKRINFDVCLEQDPGTMHLSRADLNILDEVANFFQAYDEFDMVHWCHAHLPEYEKVWNSRGGAESKRIPLPDILEAIGKSDSLDSIVGQANERAAFAQLFGDHFPTSL